MQSGRASPRCNQRGFCGLAGPDRGLNTVRVMSELMYFHLSHVVLRHEGYRYPA